MSNKHQYILETRKHRLETAYYTDTRTCSSANLILETISNAMPTDQKFLVWTVDRYCAGNFTITEINKIKSLLSEFNRLKPVLEVKDIGQYQSVAELEAVISKLTNVDTRSKNEREREYRNTLLQNNEADIILKTPEVTIIKLHSERAACFFGKNTKWCTTSAVKNDINKYYATGSLYIFINRMKKYQLHVSHSTGCITFKDDCDKHVSEELAEYLISLATTVSDQIFKDPL